MPHDQVSSNDDTIHIPKVPHPVSFQRYQISRLARPYKRFDPVSEFMRCSMNSNVKSWGTIINTFYDLEAIYIDHVQRVSGRPVWSVGPLLPPTVFEAKRARSMIERGKPPSIDDSVCLQWFDSRKEKSVIYIFFGN